MMISLGSGIISYFTSDINGVLAQRSAGILMSRLTCVRVPLGWLTVCFKKIRSIILIFYYYTPYTYYTPYVTGCGSTGDLGIAGLCQTQGSFCSVQLFGAGAHKVQWCSERLLQSISSENVSCIWNREPWYKNRVFGLNLVYTGTYWYVPVCTSINEISKYIPVCTEYVPKQSHVLWHK